MQAQLAAFERLVQAQLQTFAVGGSAVAAAPVAAAPAPVAAVVAAPAPAAPAPAPAQPAAPVAGAGPLAAGPTGGVELTAQQQAHIDALAAAYGERTAASKRYASEYRDVFSDYRSSLGFRLISKEMTYPLVVERAAGARIVDLDGHEYIDLTMAFGSCLLGHNPPTVIDALRDQLQYGIQVGPKSPLSGRAARLVSELTGMPRVAFANSGTEAAMTAVRMARAVTGRTRYARFTGSYHGHADTVLARAGKDGAGVPMTAGVPAAVAAEALVLDYGSDAALETIRRHGHTLAAVLVEPVQSRRPGLQPGEFLRRLRAIADECGFALIFDEIITGFRLARGGAQEYFGVRADLAVYGKVAGGGMPIGIVAGQPRFMNAIDGGAWRYGDASAPQPPTTFFAGTFSGHPLTMAATVAALEHVRTHADTLYPTLNARTRDMVARINAGFAADGLPIHADCAGSLFRFVFMKNYSVEFQPVEAPLFFYHMALNGVYIWEGHTCFLSEAHTDADVDAIVAAALASGRALRAGGFLGGGATPPPKADDRRRSEVLDAAAVAAFADACAEMGAGARSQAGSTVDALGEALGVTAPRQRLWRAMCAHLAAHGDWRIDADGRLHDAVLPVPADAARRFEAALDAARAAGEDESTLALLRRCRVALPNALRGRIGGTEALFADGGMALVAGVYTGAPGARPVHARLREAFAQRIRTRAAAGRPLRVLEIGAGTGGTTRELLPLLEGRDCAYTFTDVSPAFLQQAERAFGDRPGMRFALLDIERPPQEQGFFEGDYDIVVAANVIHATREIRESLDRIASLLAPGGAMLLVECAVRHAWLDLVFGLTDGWWRYADTGLRDHPLLDATTWRGVLGSQGWREVEVDVHGETLALIGASRPDADPDRVALGAMQTEILVHGQIDEAVQAAYNEGVLFELRGALDPQRLQSALDALVAAHDSLSATIAEDGTHARIRSAQAPRIGHVDFSAFPVAIARNKAREWLRLRIAEPFDLAAGPLLRTWLIAFGDGSHWLYVMSHHVVIDGMTFGALIVEWMERYAAGETAPTLPRALSMAEANRRQSQWKPEDREFWLRHLADLPPPLALPTDRPFPAEQRYEAGRIEFALPAETGARLQAFCRSAGATPFMALFGAWRVLLHKWCGQSRSVIGVPVSAHGVAPGERYIGFGVNVLPIADETDPARSWREYVESLRGELLRAMSHRAYPLPELLRELRPARDPARPPLVGSIFNYETVSALRYAALEIEALVPPIAGTKYELTLDLVGDGERYRGALSYSRALFDEPTMRALLARYAALLERLLADPAASLGSHPVLLPEESPWLVGEAVPAVAAHDHIAGRVAAQAARTPDAVALRWHDVEIDYRELDRRAERLAQRLVAAGAGPGPRVAVRLPRTPALPIALLAVLKTGAAYVPLDPAYPEERQNAILACADAALMIVDEAYAPAAPGEGPKRIALDLTGRAEGAETAAEAPPWPWRGHPDQLSHLIFTSGSTGTPKGVAIRQSSVLSLLDWAATVFDDAQIAGVVASTSICFDLSVFELFVPLTRGGRVVLVENALHLTELARTDDISLINTVPSAMAELVRADALPATLRTINLAGEALSAELVARIHTLRPDVAVYNLYGPSEDTTYSTFAKVANGAARVTIGRPVGGTGLYILDAQRNPVPAGTIGEIHLAGVGLAEGYFGREDLTAAAFVSDPIAAVPGGRMYATGDLGRLTRDGEVEYLGRGDGQVKIRGHRIETAEIEAAIARVAGIDKAQVLAVRDGGDAALVGFFAPADAAADREALAARIREALAKALPRYMIPSRLIALDAFPLTPNGKTDRTRLLQWASAPRETPRSKDAAAAAATPTEARLIALWREMLGLQDIAPNDDFFELGGHSLMATRMVTEIGRRFGRSLRLTDILRAPTIRQLANALDR
jgi:glutamate-1-semialdehyde-2,1-aminomutase